MRFALSRPRLVLMPFVLPASGLFIMCDAVPSPPCLNDPISEAVEGLDLRIWVLDPLRVSAPWSLCVDGKLGWFYLVRSGDCTIRIDDDLTQVSLHPGDLALVPQGRDHRVCDRENHRPDTPEQQLEPGRFAHRAPLNGDPSSACLSRVCFSIEKPTGNPLVTSLPSVMCVRGRGGLPATYVDYIFRLLEQETAHRTACASMVVNRLIRILLVKAVYQYSTSLPSHGAGWLQALRDPEIGRALCAIHRRPDSPWTVASLADEVALSRTVFSARFTEVVGKPPLEYITDWRMYRASALLRTTQAGLKEIAAKVGYDSAASFSKAFTRWAGTTPKAYRDQVRAASEGSHVPWITM